MNMQSADLKPNIGFIGLGHMGSHMTRRLLDAGYRLAVYDRTPTRTQEVGHWGALAAPTPKPRAISASDPPYARAMPIRSMTALLTRLPTTRPAPIEP